MSMMVFFFLLSFFPRGVLGEILNLIESVSEGFPSYSAFFFNPITNAWSAYYDFARKKLL